MGSFRRTPGRKARIPFSAPHPLEKPRGRACDHFRPANGLACAVKAVRLGLHGLIPSAAKTRCGLLKSSTLSFTPPSPYEPMVLVRADRFSVVDGSIHSQQKRKK